jgi:hypothetical protein
VTSCPFRVVEPLKLSSMCKMFGLQRPWMMPTCANELTSALNMQTLDLGDVQGYNDDVMGSQGSTSRWKSMIPLGLGLPECLQGQHPSFFLVQVLDVSLPLDGVTTSICGILAPWRSELIIPPRVPVHQAKSCSNDKYALQGFISHRDHNM